jgi:hypothetical protein
MEEKERDKPRTQGLITGGEIFGELLSLTSSTSVGKEERNNIN